jgi:hypothetical protein
MRFLHPKWSPHLLAISAVGLCFNRSLLRATENSNRVVVEADDVDLAKVQSGGEIVFVSSGQRAAVSHAIDGDHRTIFQFSISDPRPTLIVKLTNSKPLRRVSFVVGSLPIRRRRSPCKDLRSSQASVLKGCLVTDLWREICS